MRNSQNGFTMIEQIIVISVLGVLLPTIVGLFFQTFLSPVQNSAQLVTAGDLQLASDWISRDLMAGPMGNNLGAPGSAPALTSVTIASSSGYPGNNSLIITYHTWPSAGSTTPEDHTITYRLEDLDPTDDDIQLVRREDDGSMLVVAQHITDPGHVIFSGSAQAAPGGVGTGLTLSITSTLEGSTKTVTRQADIVYTLPRSYQPTPAPAPSSQTWNIGVPYYLADKSGYWQVITTAGSGNMSANWQLAAPAAIQIYIYQGQPLGSPLGNSVTTPTKVAATVLASNSASTNNLTATTSSAQSAGVYTIYYFNNSNNYVNTNVATVTYVSP